MTIGDLVPKVKELLDVAAQSSYSDSQICGYIIEGIRVLNSRQPSTRYVGGQLADPSFPTAAADILAYVLTFDERYVPGIVYYAAARCHEVGITDAVNLQLSQTLKQQAEAIFRL